MSSVSAVNPGLANLLQTLSKANSPVLSSSTVMSALENASPADLVQLNAAATQLETVSTLLGNSGGSSGNSGIDMSSILASLEPPLTGSAGLTSTSANSAANTQASSSASPTSSPGDQLTQASLQAAEATALLGPVEMAAGLPGSLFDVTG